VAYERVNPTYITASVEKCHKLLTTVHGSSYTSKDDEMNITYTNITFTFKHHAT